MTWLSIFKKLQRINNNKKSLLELIQDGHSKVAGYKLNRQKPIALLQTSNNWNLKLKHNTFTTPPKMINLSKNPTIKLDERNIYLLYLNYSPPLGKMNTVIEGGKNYLVEHLLYARYIKHSLDYYFSQL